VDAFIAAGLRCVPLSQDVSPYSALPIFRDRYGAAIPSCPLLALPLTSACNRADHCRVWLAAATARPGVEVSLWLVCVMLDARTAADAHGFSFVFLLLRN